MAFTYPPEIGHRFTEDEYWAALDKIGVYPTTEVKQLRELEPNGSYGIKPRSENVISFWREEDGVPRAELGSNLYIENSEAIRQDEEPISKIGKG